MRTQFLFICILLLNSIVNAQISYKGSNAVIMKSVNKANEIINNPIFIAKIEAIQSFDNTTYSGARIVKEMKAIKNVEIYEYYKKHTRVNAKTGKQIIINTAKLERPFAEIVNTIIHEYIHSIDLNFDNWLYTN